MHAPPSRARTSTRKVNLATKRLAPAALDSQLLPERAPEFLSFMKKREALRVAKAAGAAWPWSDDDVLNAFKFTNVKREHDRTTAWMREHFTPRAATSSAGTTVFNCALFRCFGTTAMGEAVGWSDGEYDAEAVVRAAQACRAEHGHAFTPAYCLPRFNSEITSADAARRTYESVCSKTLQGVWDRREQLGRACGTGSWRALCDELRGVSGFGGSGFMAKEVALDVMQTPHLRLCHDRNDWCPIGPGARRGLNRLHRRPTTQAVSVVGGPCEQRFLKEMSALFDEIRRVEPTWCDSLALELHDVQFQLCEFDKYERIRCSEGGKKTKYPRPLAAAQGVARMKVE